MTLCPNGLVIPDDPDSSGNWFPNKALSNCTVSCLQPPYFTNDQRDTLAALDLVSMIAAAVLSALVLSIWLHDNLKRKQAFVVSYGVVVTFCFTVLSILFPFEKRCQNNANTINGSQGLTLCGLEGAVLLFMENFCAMCFCLQSYELFRRFVLLSRAPVNKVLYLNLILGLPLVISLLSLYLGLFHATFGGDFCRVTGTSIVSLAFAYGTMLIATVAGLLFTLAIVIKLVGLICIKSVSKHDGLLLAGTSMKYMIFSGCYLLSLLLIAKFSPLFDDDAFRNSVDEWAQCALQYFDGSDDSSYTNICGEHAARNMTFLSYATLTVYYRAGFGLFFVVVNFEGLQVLLRKHICSATVAPHRLGGDSNWVSVSSGDNISGNCDDDHGGGISPVASIARGLTINVNNDNNTHRIASSLSQQKPRRSPPKRWLQWPISGLYAISEHPHTEEVDSIVTVRATAKTNNNMSVMSIMEGGGSVNGGAVDAILL